MKRTARTALTVIATIAVAALMVSCTPSTDMNEVDAATRALRAAGVKVTDKVVCTEDSTLDTPSYSQWNMTCRHRSDVAHIVAKYVPDHTFASVVAGVDNRGKVALLGCNYVRTGDQWRNVRC